MTEQRMMRFRTENSRDDTVNNTADESFPRKGSKKAKAKASGNLTPIRNIYLGKEKIPESLEQAKAKLRKRSEN